MPKTCTHSECNNRVFSNNYCRWHQHLRSDFKHSQLKRTPINKQSDKERVRLQQYRKARIEQLKEKPLCEAKLEGCTHQASQVHHKRGRIGSLLTDRTYFLSVCHSCHQKIETQPHLAKELNLSESRLNKAS